MLQVSTSGREGTLYQRYGLDEDIELEYTRNQEKADEHQDQLRFGL